jgi:hypothetical protein
VEKILGSSHCSPSAQEAKKMGGRKGKNGGGGGGGEASWVHVPRPHW